MQQIHSTCKLKCEDLGQQKEQTDKHAKVKAAKEQKNEERAIIASIASGVAAIVFPPAVALFGSVTAFETFNAKRHGKKH